MIPRPPQCDDDRCDYDTTGTWRHHARCRAQDPWPEDMAWSTAMEDGYAGRPVRRPVATRGGEAA